MQKKDVKPEKSSPLSLTKAYASTLDSIQNYPNNYFNSVLKDLRIQYPNQTYNNVLQNTEMQSLIGYNLSNPTNTKLSLENTLNSPRISLQANIILTEYNNLLENKFNAFMQSNALADSVDVSSIANVLRQTTISMKNQVVNRNGLATSEKDALLYVFTMIEESSLDIANLSAVLALEIDSQDKFFRRLWNGIRNVARVAARVVVITVRIAFSIAYQILGGAYVGALIGIGIGLATLDPKAVGLGSIVGATFGLIRGIVNVFRNECFRIGAYNSNGTRGINWSSCW